MIASILVLVLVLTLLAALLRALDEAGEAGYRRAQLGGRRGVERWASPWRRGP